MKSTLLLSDVVAVVDSREQTPFDLAPMRIETGTLNVGDYSVAGLESVVAIERKSLSDLVACCGRERKRFQTELDRLRGWLVSAVILECGWTELERGEWRSKLTPGQVQSSLASWIAQGHRIILGENHPTAAKITRGILYYAARYRFRESCELMNRIQDADQLRRIQKENRSADDRRLSN